MAPAWAVLRVAVSVSESHFRAPEVFSLSLVASFRRWASSKASTTSGGRFASASDRAHFEEQDNLSGFVRSCRNQTLADLPRGLPLIPGSSFAPLRPRSRPPRALRPKETGSGARGNTEH